MGAPTCDYLYAWWRLARPTRLPCIQASQPPQCIGSSPGTIAGTGSYRAVSQRWTPSRISDDRAEQAFLQPFFARAERGEIATAEQIHQALEAEVQHEVHLDTIFASCIDMAGASWLRVRVIPRRTSKNKTRFKKNTTRVQVALSTREAT